MPKRDVRSMSLTSQESYSAIIIADMVAEVEERDEHEHQLPPPRGSLTKSQEHHNLGYEAKLDATPAAIVNVDVTETVDLGQKSSNGTDISKGIILNANSISQPGGLTKGSMEMSNSYEQSKSQTDPGKEDEIGGFATMSFSRKIAFGFSFVPSIVFVLCFAVFLPCKEPVPCVQEMWVKTFNDTDISANSKIPEKIVYSFAKGSSNGLASLLTNSGTEEWSKTWKSKIRFIDCGYTFGANQLGCVFVDKFGNMNSINISNGNVKRESSNLAADPVLLPACKENGIQPVAFLLESSLNIKVLDGSLNPIPVFCESSPSRLIPWTHENGTDLIFYCKQKSQENLIKISKSDWCSEVAETYNISLKSSPEDISKAVFLTTPQGLAIWSENKLSFFSKYGQELWNVSPQHHGENNRFMVYGKFRNSENELALFSNNFRNELKVSLHDMLHGKADWNPTISDTVLNDVSLLHGQEHDFVLLAYRKITRASPSGLVDQLSTMASALVLSEADIAADIVTDATSFMELGTQTKSLSPFQEQESKILHQTSMIVADTSGDSMNLFVLRKALTDSQVLKSELQALDVRNWDITSSKNAVCYWKS